MNGLMTYLPQAGGSFSFLCRQRPKEEGNNPNGMPIPERLKLTCGAIRIE